MPAFALVVNNKDEILLIQRADGKNRGLWSLPGGKRDPGETLKETAVRETYEETGIKMAAVELYHSSKRYSFEIWRGKRIGGHLKVQKKECLDAKWFPKDMLPHDNNLAFGPDEKALGKWASEHRGSRRVYYPRSKMDRSGFSLITNHQNEVLLIQRRTGKRAGKWSLPGGNVGHGRSRTTAAIEETQKAIGARVSLTRLYYENRHRAKIWLGEIQTPMPKLLNGRWFPLSELPDDDSLGFAIDVRTIEKWASENDGSGRAHYS